jgi:hypothetical protein
VNSMQLREALGMRLEKDLSVYNIGVREDVTTTFPHSPAEAGDANATE